jgi:glutaredoxin 3
MTTTVEIYTKFACPYCVRAKHLLDSKGVTYTEYDVTMGGAKRAEMVARASGARTVPQIFINDIAIGGSDDLRTLDAQGKLDSLLGASGA